MKNHVFTVVEPVILSPLVDQLTGFGQVTALTIEQNFFSSYGAIDNIDLEENTVKVMGPYNPSKPLFQLIEKLEKGREFAQAGGYTISNANIMSKDITLLTQTGVFNDKI